MFNRGVFGYAGINARIRAMYATLLSPEEWTELVNAVDFPALLGLLRRTSYGSYLARVEDKDLTPRRVVYQVNSQMADTYTTVIRSAPDQTCPLISELYRSYEEENLKAVLRGIRAGAAWSQVRYVLFPIGPMGVLPGEAMLETGNITPAVELLRGTPYHTTLAYAMERFNTEQSLFPLEVALDLDYWRRIWKDINDLPKDDREWAARIVGLLLDVNNLMWAIRYRVYYKLSEEEIINYTLPLGYHVRPQDVTAVATGADIAQVVSRLYPKITDVPVLLTDPRKGLPELEVQLLRSVREQCREAMVGYPFHIGVILAFLILKQFEIKDLTVLVEAKASRTPVEGFRPYLIIGNLIK